MWTVIYDPFTKLVRTLYEMIEIMKWDHVYGFYGMMFYFNGLVCDGRKDWWIFLKGLCQGASWALHWLGFGNPPPHALKMGWACLEERLLAACIRCMLARDIDMEVIVKMRIVNHNSLSWCEMWCYVIGWDSWTLKFCPSFMPRLNSLATRGLGPPEPRLFFATLKVPYHRTR